MEKSKKIKQVGENKKHLKRTPLLHHQAYKDHKAEAIIRQKVDTICDYAWVHNEKLIKWVKLN